MYTHIVTPSVSTWWEIYEIEAIGPLILLENSRTGSGVLCGFTLPTMRCIVDLGQWIVVHHPRGDSDWRFVEPLVDRREN